MPTLFARLAVIRRVRARQQLTAFRSMFAAARGEPEYAQQIDDLLSQAAGERSSMGDFDDFLRAVGG